MTGMTAEDHDEAQARRASYDPLERPEPRRGPCETTQRAFNFGMACGRLGLGIPDFAVVAGAIGTSGVLSEEETHKRRESRFRAACSGHKLGRRAAGLPDLPSWARSLEEQIARNAS